MAPLFLLTLGCVVRYGAPVETLINEEIPAPVSFSEISTRLTILIEEEQDVDRLDRLAAARDLAAQMKGQPPDSQRYVLDYLTVLVEIEERNNPMSLWLDAEGDSSALISMPMIEEEIIEEEQLDSSDSSGSDSSGSDLSNEPVAPQAASGTAEMLETAREHIAAGDPYSAMQALEGCREQLCWMEVAGLWSRARDLYVYQRREEAAAAFLSTRAEEDTAARIEKLHEVESSLNALLSEYPNTRYAPALQRNVALVQGELTALTEP